ncbi:MAG: hypothetical protein KatS3mg105_0983 [Gemmatales bacterium]|nr:MAG: hypothetical protein KatS3mg105_0983 [Gemmatales bacterium]
MLVPGLPAPRILHGVTVLTPLPPRSLSVQLDNNRQVREGPPRAMTIPWTGPPMPLPEIVLVTTGKSERKNG